MSSTSTAVFGTILGVCGLVFAVSGLRKRLLWMKLGGLALLAMGVLLQIGPAAPRDSIHVALQQSITSSAPLPPPGPTESAAPAGHRNPGRPPSPSPGSPSSS